MCLLRGGAAACRAAGVPAGHLLAVDREGAAGGGIPAFARRRHVAPPGLAGGALRGGRRRVDPLPASMAGADADPGAPLGRPGLRPPRQDARALARRLPQVPGRC